MEILVYDQFDAASDKAFDFFVQALAALVPNLWLSNWFDSRSTLPTLSRVRFRF